MAWGSLHLNSDSAVRISRKWSAKPRVEASVGVMWLAIWFVLLVWYVPRLAIVLAVVFAAVRLGVMLQEAFVSWLKRSPKRELRYSLFLENIRSTGRNVFFGC